MNRARLLSCCLMIAASGSGSVAGQQASILDALTAPEAMLPAGCALTPSPSERRGARVVSGFWDGLPVRTNPWTGEHPRVVGHIRTRMFGPPRMPDAPPDARIAAKLERDLAEGLSGYAAFYRQGDARVSVYALRGAGLPQWKPSPSAEGGDSAGRGVARIRRGEVAVLAVGDAGPCFAAVERHLRAGGG
jgi:hypothetical protein